MPRHRPVITPTRRPGLCAALERRLMRAADHVGLHRARPPLAMALTALTALVALAGAGLTVHLSA